MDKSLDEIISDRYREGHGGGFRGSRGNRGRGGRRGGGGPRGGISKGNYRGGRRNGPHQGSRPHARPNLANTIKITNLHYELSEDDIHELLTRVGPVRKVSIDYDKSDRSMGVAYANFESAHDAQEAVHQFDGKRAAGLQISVTLLDSSGLLRNRLTLPSSGDDQEDLMDEGSKRNDDAEDAGTRRSDNDRYGSRGQRQQHSGPVHRPRKTVEELDAELTDYMNGVSSTTAQENEDS